MKDDSAVEFLFKEIYGDTGYIGSYTIEGRDAFTALKAAKKIFRKQIEDAYNAGMKIDGYHYNAPCGDVYFELTYKTK